MSSRPDDGYQAAARIGDRGSRRTRGVAVLLAIAVVAWAGATVTGRLGGRPTASDVAAGSLAPATADLGPSTPEPSLPSDAEVFRPRAPIGTVPVALDGLAWLDLRTGTVTTRLALAADEWMFALANGGSACVCVERPSGVTPSTLRLLRFSATGEIDWANSVSEWLPAGQRFQPADAVLLPGGTEALIGALVEDGSTWDVRLQRAALGSEPVVVETRLRRIDLTPLGGDPARIRLRMFATPDGRRARITLGALADDLSTVDGSVRGWDVTLRGSGFGPFEPVPAGTLVGAPDTTTASGTSCGGAAWAGPGTFVELCQSPSPDSSGQVPFVRLEPLGAKPREVDLGATAPGDVVGWLVDGTHGKVFAWAALSHRLDRVDVRTGKLAEQTVGAVTDSLARLRAITPNPGQSPTPQSLGEPISWQPIGSARAPVGSPLVGSADGTRLYAAGLAFPTTPGSFSALDSTGIWVFDARSLDLIGHWQAVAAYDSLAMTPTGRYLVAIGNPSGKELDAFGNHGRELALIDPFDGSTVAIQRRLVLRLGGSPSLLPAPVLPVPGG